MFKHWNGWENQLWTAGLIAVSAALFATRVPLF